MLDSQRISRDKSLIAFSVNSRKINVNLNFKDANSIRDTICAGDDVARRRGLNRVKITEQANAFPPLTDAEATAQKLKINVNFMQQPLLHAAALRQYTRNFNGTNHFFKVAIPTAPVEMESEWASFITEHINGVLKDSRPYHFLGTDRFTSLVSHGIAPQMWWDKEDWMPQFIPLADWRVATDTEESFRNLEWQAVRLNTTEGELSEKVFGPNADKNWNKPAIAKILHAYRNQNYQDIGNTTTWLDDPERMASIVKQNGGLHSSDAVPTVSLWHFLFKDRIKAKTKWMLRVIPDWNVQGDISAANNEFLYDSSDEPFATDLSHFLHVQFGDLNNDAPRKVWSVRSLGLELLDLCFWDNLLFCRTLQHLMENMNPWLRITDPAGKARAQLVDMYDKAIIPEGVTIVPQDQRHQVNQNLIQYMLSQVKQRIGEASATYTQQSDTGTQKEQTAYETAVKMSMVNAMMEALLLEASFQEKFSYMEICRRLCLRRSSNEDARRFQAACKRRGIPLVYINANLWKITPELPIGSGNPAMAISQAQQLLQIRSMYGPQAQQEILHEVTAIFTGSANKAARWAPLGEGRKATPAQKVAEADFLVLYSGKPVNLMESESLSEQADTLLGLLAGEITLLLKVGDAGPRTIFGLGNVAHWIEGLIETISRNPPDQEKANELGKQLAELQKEIGLVEKQMAAKQQPQGNGQMDPAALAKSQAALMQADVKGKVTEANAAQKRTHKDLDFTAKEQRKQEEFVSAEQRKSVQAGTQVARDHVTTGAEIKRDGARTTADIQQDSVRTLADIINQEATAKANLEAKVKNE